MRLAWLLSFVLAHAVYLAVDAAAAANDDITATAPLVPSSGVATIFAFTSTKDLTTLSSKVAFTAAADCAGVADGDYIVLTGANPTYTATLTPPGLAELKLCVKNSDDASAGMVQTDGKFTPAAATAGTVVTSVSPSLIPENAAASLTLTGTVFVANDKASVVKETESCGTPAIVPVNVDATSKTVAFDPTSTGKGNYVVCYQTENLGVLRIPAAAVVVAEVTGGTVVTAVTPDSATVNTATTFTLTGATDGKASFILAAAPCPAVDNLPLTVTGTTVEFTPVNAEAHKLCYQASGKTPFLQTSMTFAVVTATANNVVTGVTAPDGGMKANVAGEITLAGPPDNSKVSFTTAAACTQPLEFTTIVSLKTTATLPVKGTYIVCYQKVGGSDAVKQVDLTIDVAGTALDVVTQIVPSSISEGSTSTITFEGTTIADDDKVIFVASDASCIGQTPNIVVTGKQIASAVDALVNGSYQVCYQSKDNSDSAKQGALTFEVKESTLPDVVTKITSDPASPTAEIEVTVTMEGDIVSGSKVAFTAEADCAAATPDISVDAAAKTVTFEPSAQGTYIMCYRSPGGDDAVMQTDIKLVVGQKTMQTNGVARMQIPLFSGFLVVLGLALW